MTKVCTKCGIERPLSEFYERKSTGGLNPHCKSCYREWHRQRYTPKQGADDSARPCATCGTIYQPKSRRPSLYCSRRCGDEARKASGQRRENHLQRRFGISQADYEAMLAAQGGGCALCGKRPEDQKRFPTYLHVDHCHETGRVRGLLCDQHNLLLGRFNDDPALLRKAADYLDA